MKTILISLLLMLAAAPALAHEDDAPAAQAGPQRPAWGPWVVVLYGNGWTAPYEGWFQTKKDCQAAGKQAVGNRSSAKGASANIFYTCFTVSQ